MEITLPYNYEPRLYQTPAWQHFQQDMEGLRGVLVWHRRAGKDLFAINTIVPKMFQRVGVYWHMLPTYKQGRSIVWNGFTRDGRKFLDHFPPRLVQGKNATEMRITMINDSIYQVVGTDDIDSLVGTNPIGVVFSEYSLHNPNAWNYIRPILAENGGWALFIYTARGRNHGYTLFQMAQSNKKWFCQRLVAGDKGTKRPDGTPVISDEIIQEEREAGMEEEMIDQEFFCSFDSAMVGAYYGKQMKAAEEQGRITRVPHEPNLLVETWWDIGVGDSTAIWFVQKHAFEVRIIDYYENSGEGLPHYARVLAGQVDGGAHRKDYTYSHHIAPQDIKVREFSDGKARIDTARKLGIRFSVCPKHRVEDRIESVRSMLPKCWFDEIRCQAGIDGLKSYRKEFDEKKKVFKDNPVHDWTSHPADAFGYGSRTGKAHSRKQDRQSKAIDQHQYI